MPTTNSLVASAPPQRRMAQLHVPWRRTHATARRGQYSLERLCALKVYSESKSTLHALLVCVVTIAIPLLVILALDVVPLQAPSKGWAANYALWYRVFIGAFLLAIGVSFQAQAMAPAAALTVRKSVYIGLYTATGNLAYSVLLAKLWVFPIPFMTVVSLPSWLACFFASTVVAVGAHNLQRNAALQAQIKRFATRLTFEAAFLFVYPVYNVVFLSLDGWNQFAIIFVLPALKYVLKRSMRRIMGDLEDLVPVVVISVDLFHALYQSKCMQSSGSLYTTIGIIAIDAIQNVVGLYQLFRLMREVTDLTTADVDAQGLFLYALQLVDKPGQLAPDAFLLLRVRSCSSIRLPRSKADAIQRATVTQIELLRNASMTNSVASTPRRNNNSLGRTLTLQSPTTVAPLLMVAPLVHSATAPASINTLTQSAKIMPLGGRSGDSGRQRRPRLSSTEKAALLQKTAELVWKCELMLLVEYIEAAIPLLYAVYLTVLHKLPNAQYYPGVAAISPERLNQIVTSILMYAALELLSLAVVHATLQFKFQMSALHQLAFALENERLLVQGMFMGWAIVLLQFTLVHFGIDLTFQFEWMTHNT